MTTIEGRPYKRPGVPTTARPRADVVGMLLRATLDSILPAEGGPRRFRRADDGRELLPGDANLIRDARLLEACAWRDWHAVVQRQVEWEQRRRDQILDLLTRHDPMPGRRLAVVLAEMNPGDRAQLDRLVAAPNPHTTGPVMDWLTDWHNVMAANGRA